MVNHVSGQELEKLLKAGAALVDVREQQDLLKHPPLPGTIHIPLSKLTEHLESMPKEVPTIFYCRSGLLSYQAAEISSCNKPNDAYYLEGGLIKYCEQ